MERELTETEAKILDSYRTLTYVGQRKGREVGRFIHRVFDRITLREHYRRHYEKFLTEALSKHPHIVKADTINIPPGEYSDLICIANKVNFGDATLTFLSILKNQEREGK